MSNGYFYWSEIIYLGSTLRSIWLSVVMTMAYPDVKPLMYKKELTNMIELSLYKWHEFKLKFLQYLCASHCFLSVKLDQWIGCIQLGLFSKVQ